MEIPCATSTSFPYSPLAFSCQPVEVAEAQAIAIHHLSQPVLQQLPVMRPAAHQVQAVPVLHRVRLVALQAAQVRLVAQLQPVAQAHQALLLPVARL